jgi:hypothetical protein
VARYKTALKIMRLETSKYALQVIEKNIKEDLMPKRILQLEEEIRQSQKKD